MGSSRPGDVWCDTHDTCLCHFRTSGYRPLFTYNTLNLLSKRRVEVRLGKRVSARKEESVTK